MVGVEYVFLLVLYVLFDLGDEVLIVELCFFFYVV